MARQQPAMKSHFLQEISYLLDHYVLGTWSSASATQSAQLATASASRVAPRSNSLSERHAEVAQPN
jgi:hypothetical protein